MGRHRSRSSEQLLDQLESIGRAMGYSAEHEVPVLGGSEQAMDVCWFAAEHRAAPLFIFEVETSARRELAANVSKIYAKRTDTLLKPLFFFHIVMKGGMASPAIDDLKRQYGEQNYRLFRLEDESLGDLVIAVLGQHRRLTRRLDLVALFFVIAETLEAEELALIVETCFELDLVANYRRAAGLLTLQDMPKGQPSLVLVLERLWEKAESGNEPSFAHSQGEPSGWGTPVWDVDLLEGAVLARLKPQWGPEVRQKLASLELRQVEGRDMDYDFHLLGNMPIIWVLLAILDRELLPTSMRHLRHLVDGPIDSPYGYLPPAWKAPAMVWLLHLACATDDQTNYNVAREALDALGGISRQALLDPDVAYWFTGDEEWFETYWNDQEPIPEMATLARSMEAPGEPPPDPVAIVLELLLHDRAWTETRGSQILIPLYERAPN